ncbi:MAG: hypothetical protein KBC44_03400 [Candidatus Pacebacteria bacterium]|nr:hypothetical protein [Candidatus Paceibacterota bacterium]
METVLEDNSHYSRKGTSVVMSQAIELLDLRKAKERLQLPDPRGKSWTEEEANIAEKWYKRFLQTALNYPKETLIPSVLVDEVWHQHILDTRQYPEDCKKIFGHYLHHDPYFGTSPEGEKVLQVLFKKTNDLYIAQFGEDVMNAEPLMDLRNAAKSCK